MLRSSLAFSCISKRRSPFHGSKNVTLQAGPLFQFFHLQSVKIETAAAAHEIAGVLPETATQLKKQLMELAQEEDVNAS